MTNANDRTVSFDDEMLILVDDDDNVVGYRDKVSCHLGDGVLHRAFSIFIFNDAGELLLQQRSDQKMLWPLIWSNSCCSHPRKGETLENATLRRLAEELGFTTDLQHLFTFQYTARYQDVGTENEMCAVYIGRSNEKPRVNPNEIADWKYVPFDEVTNELGRHPDVYSPWMKMEWERMMLEHRAEIEAMIRRP